MNQKLHAVIAAAALCGATAVFGAGDNKASATVSFDNPEKFTDFRLTQMGGESEQSILEKQIQKAMADMTADRLPAGYKLDVRFNDIDMAGDFEPWHHRLQDTRIMRDRYPPRLSFSYTVTDGEGKVVDSGEKKLYDSTYQWRMRPITGSNRETQIEADLLGDFIRDLSRSLNRSPS